MATTNINELEKTLDDLDPSRVAARDAVHFRRIIRQQRALAALIGSCTTPSARPARPGTPG